MVGRKKKEGSIIALYKIDNNKQAIPIVPPSTQPTFWVPDYANGQPITLPITATRTGYIVCNVRSGNLEINGHVAFRNLGASSVAACVLVNKGDVIVINGSVDSGEFFPIKAGDLL